MNAPSSKRPRGVKGTKSPRRRSAEASLKKGSPAGVGDDTSRGAFPIVGIGASAGGLEAFTELLKALPDDTGMSFVLVQHLDPERESQLSQILARATLLPVHEIAGEERVRPNHVYIISPNTELTLVKGVLKAQSRERTRTPHRPIDSFFESLAQDQRERAVGVVLSGTATDGTLGLEAIKAEGGLTFAQDASAKYDSMPRSAAAAGCVDLVLSPAEIAHELARIAKHPYVVGEALPSLAERARPMPRAPLPSGGKAAPERAPESADDGAEAEPYRNGKDGRADYRKILLLLRNHSGVDFSLYKPTTMQRRINRRLVLSKQETLETYAGFLSGNIKELDVLYSDVLISVTSFFRNPEAFDVLEQKVLPQLLKMRGGDPLRCWVIGCSTGQEAYSIAMAFAEAADDAPRARRVQIFATDVNDALLDKARQGLYARGLIEGLTPQRLRRFFVEEDGGYRVAKSLREMIVFARQNLIADPPFSRMDLISCRNLLIYLEPSLQKRAIPTFHYALKPHGYLLLGASESVDTFTGLFEPIDKKHKIYSKKAASPLALGLLLKREGGVEAPAARPPLLTQKSEGPVLTEGFAGGELSAQREADRVTVSQFAPPGVLVNAELAVLQFRGSTSAFLQPPVGKASFDVLKMAREGLMLPLRSAINQAKKENKTARRDRVRVKQNGKTCTVKLEVIPLKNLRERCYLILFEETEKVSAEATPGPEPKRARKGRAQASDEPSRVAELEAELAELREYLQSMQEQHDADHEELQSANEEIQSSNEEMQSINEELETSKEELESANEELLTVNEEMSNRNVELNRLNSDLVNLQASTKLAVVLFARDLTVRRFSQQAERQFDLLLTDVGRPINHLRYGLTELSLPVPNRQTRASASTERPLDLERIVSEVIAEVREQEHEVLDKTGRWHSLRMRPYLTLDNKVDGAVLVLADIDALKRSEQATAASRDYAESIVDTVRTPLLVLDPELRVESANRSFYRVFRVAPAETIGKIVFELGNRQWNIPRLRELLDVLTAQSTTIEDFAIEHDFAILGRRTMLFSARRMQNPADTSERILVSIEDITDRARAEAATSQLAAIVESSDDAMISKTPDGVIRSWNHGAEKLFGYSAAEAIGQNIVFIVPAERRADEAEVLARLGRGDGVERFETEQVAKDGRRIAVSLADSPIRDAHGKVIGASRIIRDITGQRRVEQRVRESEERYRTLIAQVKDYAIFRTDTEGRATTWNEGVKHVLGFDEDEFLGVDITHAIFTPEDVQSGVARRELDEAAANGTAGNDRWMRRKSGEHFFANGVTTALRDTRGKLMGFTKVMRDQTEKMQVDEAQRQLASELRTHSAELSEASDRKNEFLAMLGHELRNPLSAVSYGLELLDKLPDDNPRRHELRTMMGRQTRRINTLLDQLLDLARVTSGKIELTMARVDLADVVRSAAETVRPLMERQHHKLTLTVPPEPSAFVSCDAVRMAQVVENLLTNAAKYTHPGGRIELLLEVVSDKVRLIVRDNGTGMSAELLPRVFEVFTQAPRTLARSKGGLGLGLALVQRLVAMHGGQITASSAGLGRGSEFVVTLPRASRAHEEREEEEEEGVAPHERRAVAGEPSVMQAHRILVVDDGQDIREALAALLEAEGHQTLAVNDGPDALKAIGAFDPDVVLLDLGLPEMDGYEVARRLRDEHPKKRMLLIAVTGYQADPARLKQAGFDDHLIKPPNLETLSGLLTAWDRGER
jgi:two-component system CheB/CheR fusion protein